MAYTQQGSKLVGTGYTQGNSVALSSDGNTLAVGGPDDGSGIGSTCIWIRSGSSWSQQGAKLIGSGATGYANQGESVALSSDGNTLAVGGPTDNSAHGAVWIYTRTGSTWTQQGTKLVGSGSAGYNLQGYSVALSSDGNTLAVGGPWEFSAAPFAGAAWIWTRSGSTWTEQAQLIGSPNSSQDTQGTSVSLSSDGDTVAIGAPGNGISPDGSTWIWTRSGSSWTQQSQLIGSGSIGYGGSQGTSVSLSSDGNTVAIGAPDDNYTYPNGGIGATWIFTRSGSSWSEQQKLIGIGYTGYPSQGQSVSLIGTGNTVAIGGYNNTSAGATWIWTRSGSTWTQQGSTPLVGSSYTGGTPSQGYSVALSTDATTLAIGGPSDGSSTGAVWIFTDGGGTTTTTTTTAAPTAKQFTLTNTGAASGTIDTFTFNDPASIGHTANLANLGGGSAVTGNVTGLGYTLGVSSSIIFTVDYNDAGAGNGTYSGNVVIGGSGSTSQTITSTINVGSSPTTTTTTTAGPTTTTTTTTSTTTAGPGTLGYVGGTAPYDYENSTGIDPPISGSTLNLSFTNQGVVAMSDLTGNSPEVNNLPTQWFTPTGGGIGASYDIKITSMTGTCTGGTRAYYNIFGGGDTGTDPSLYTLPDWISLSTNQTIIVGIGSAPIVGASTGLTMQIAIAPSGDHSSPITAQFSLVIGAI